MTAMSTEAYEALRVAVRLTRDEQIKRTSVLLARLKELGHRDEAVKDALEYWADYNARTWRQP